VHGTAQDSGGHRDASCNAVVQLALVGLLSHEELDTHPRRHKQSTPRAGEGLPAGAARCRTVRKGDR